MPFPSGPTRPGSTRSRLVRRPPFRQAPDLQALHQELCRQRPLPLPEVVSSEDDFNLRFVQIVFALDDFVFFLKNGTGWEEDDFTFNVILSLNDLTLFHKKKKFKRPNFTNN